MSHTVKIETNIKFINPLKAALATFGWEVEENTKGMTYIGMSKETYDYVAKNPKRGGYDLLINMGDGKLDISTDFYGGSVAATLGQNLEKLKQEYAYRVIEEHYLFAGADVNKQQNEDGTLTVTVDLP